MTSIIREIDRISVTTLQDNYVDVLAMDGNEVIQRPLPVRQRREMEMELVASPLAEHGFSTFIKTTAKGRDRTLLFDFGCSANGARKNADLLSIDLSTVEAMALSHGHLDHTGGLKALAGCTQRDDLALVAHPAAFRENRHIITEAGVKIFFPPFTRDQVREAGLAVRESAGPMAFADGTALFLGEIPRSTHFEEGMKNAFYERDGEDIPDTIPDDSALVFNLRGKGLVVVSGCAHSGIVNTVTHAKNVTGIETVHVVMGGFHLTGADVSTVVKPTLAALKAFQPEYVIPTHCTGREAVMAIEKEMTGQFILNMSGTTLVFENR